MSFPIMKGDARMATGAGYFEVPLFSHVIDGLWQGCSPSEFPDFLEKYGYETRKIPHPYPAEIKKYVYSKLPVDCRWLLDESYDADTDEPGPQVPRFDAILNLYMWGEYNAPELTEVVIKEMYDGHNSPNNVDELVEIVWRWMEAGKKVLVHCQAGLNRSSLIVAALLIKKFGMTPDNAINHIRESRSNMCLCNEDFVAYLKGLA